MSDQTDSAIDVDGIAAEIAASMGGGDVTEPAGEEPVGEPEKAAGGEQVQAQTEQAEAEGEEAEADEGDDAGDQDGDGSAEDDGPQPLQQWSDERKAAFLTLPNEARELVLDQAKDNDRTLNARMQEVARERRTYDGLMRALDPVSEILRESGTAPEEAVTAFIQAHMQLQRDPVAGITAIIQRQLGSLPENERASKLRQIADGAGLKIDAPDDGDDDYLDPRAKDEIAGLKAELAEVRKSFKDMTTAAQEQAQSSTMTEVRAVYDEFRAAKLDDGSPKYPHLEVVGQRMGRMFQSGFAEGETLRDIVENAYHAAVSMDPALRGKVTAGSGVADLSVARRRAASPARRSVSASPGYVSKGNIDDDIDAAARAHGF